MSKKLQEMIRENQKRNNLNIKMFSVASKSVEVEDKKNNKSTKKQDKMNNKKNKFKSSIVMALSAGKETTEGGNFKFYKGITPIGCKLVCPTKDELTEMLGRDWPKDMVYTKTDDKGIAQANVTFPMTIDANVNGEDIHIMVLQNITLKNAPRYNTNGDKFQVVDKWGNFAWVTEADFTAHNTPLSANGNPLKIDASSWRKAWQGEENLMKFLKPRLNIPDAFEYKDKKWSLKANTTGCECRLDNIADYFKGNFYEIQSALNCMPENKVKGYLYVKEYEGKQYHAIANEYVNLASNKYDAILQALEKINSDQNTNFDICELQEYKVESTQFAQSNAQMPQAANPFETQNSPWN